MVPDYVSSQIHNAQLRRRKVGGILFQVVRYLIGMSAMPYAMPLRILQRGEFLHRPEDAGGIRLAYVYFEDEPTRRALVRLLRRHEAKAVAQAITAH